MVVIKEYEKMFWGLTLEAGRKYSQTVQTPFHISMAALEVNAHVNETSPAQVVLTYNNSDYLLCTLDRQHFNQALDLNFGKGECVNFSLNGTASVHLTGYNIPEDDEEPFMDDYDDGDVDSDLQYDSEEIPQLMATVADDDDDDEEDDSDWEPPLVGTKRKAGKVLKAFTSKKMKTKELDGDEDEDDDDDEEEYDSSFIDDSTVMDDDSEEEGDGELESYDEVDSDDPIFEKLKKSKSTPTKQQNVSIEKSASSKKKNKKSPKEKESPKEKVKVKEAVNGAGDAGSAAEKKKKKKKKKKNKNKEGAEEENEPQQQEQPSKKTKENGGKEEDGAKATHQIGKPRKVSGGTVVEDLKLGHGPEAKPGRMAHVYYMGTLAKNNKRFDSHLKGKPFNFRIGKGQVIKGWETGVIGMKVGGKRKMIIPPGQAYGNAREGPIPAGSTLVFEVELKAIS